MLHPSGSRVSITPPEFRASPHIKPPSSRANSCKGSVRVGYTEKRRPASTRSQGLDLTVRGIKASGLNIHEPTPTPDYLNRSRAEPRIPTPNVSRGFHGWRPQPTIIGVVDPAQSFIPPSPQIDDVTPQNDFLLESPEPQIPERTMTPAQRISRASRAQSAALSRPKITPTRPVKSAKARSDASSSISIQLNDKELGKKASESYWAQLKHEIESVEDDVVEEIERPPTPVNLRTPSPTEVATPTYEQQVDKYGWLAEVHGDPLNLKVLTERLPYTVKCAEPEVAEYPYKTKVMVGDTFFLNTIPRRKMTFAVHPEWQSEQFIAQRKELEKTGKKFHTRNFGFVY